MNDWELIQRYADGRDDAAFEELVRRHAGFVLASARRQVGADLAEDVTQAVFLVLARKASALGPGVVLPAWLFRTTRFVVTRAQRQEARRQRRETEAATMHTTTEPAVGAGSEGVDPRLDAHLDDALAALSEADRRVVLMRFFERQRFASLGARIGVSEEAAKKRLGRALERMRVFLAGRGTVLSVGAVAAWLAVPRVEAVPDALLARVRASAARGGGVGVGGHVGGWVEGALVDGLRAAWWEALRTWGVGAVAVGCLVAVVGWWASGVVAQRAEPVGTVEPFGVGPVPGTGFGSRGFGAAGPKAANSFLELSVVDDVTGVPLAGVSIEERRIPERVPSAEASIVVSSTDHAGRVRIAWGGAAGDQLALGLTHPGRVPVTLRWRGYEFGPDGLDYQCRMARGRLFSGEVRNEAGEPVEGAEVILVTGGEGEGETRLDAQVSVTVRSDAQGRFQTDQLPGVRALEMDPRLARMRPGRSLEVSVTHPHYAVHRSQVDTEEEFRRLWSVTLLRGHPLVGQVTDVEGGPVAGAWVWQSGWPRSRGVSTGADGAFELPQASLGDGLSFEFDVEAVGYRRHHGLVAFLEEEPPALAQSGVVDLVRGEGRAPSVGDVTRVHAWKPVLGPSGELLEGARVEVRLEPMPLAHGGEDSGRGDGEVDVKRWIGRVVDAGTGSPLARFGVHLVSQHGLRSFLGEGRDGGFDWETTEVTRRMREVSLIATTEGQISAGAAGRWDEDGVLRFEFQVPSSAKLEGWLELPGGRPAVGAVIRSAGGVGTIPLDGEGRWGAAAGDVVTGREGRFSLEWDMKSVALHAVHEEGCGIFPCQPGGPTVYRLEPWATVEGEVVRDGEPVVGAVVALGSDPARTEPGSVGFRFRASATTDGAGRFLFRRVPPGRHPLGVAGEGGAEGGAGAAARSVEVLHGKASPVRLEVR